MGWRFRGAWALLAVVALVGAGACAGDSEGEGATRRVLVDYTSDRFASMAFFNFPAKVTVRQGDTVEFRQTWTGEPHTVTGGTSVTEMIAAGGTWIDFFESYEGLLAAGEALPNPDEPGDATIGDLAKAVADAEDAELREQFTESYEELRASGVALPALEASSTEPFGPTVEFVDAESEKVFSQLPFAFDDEDQLAQNVGQPCYLEEGGPPEEPTEPCAKDDQRQPEFDGRQSYYNSGVIPYEGERGNTFEVDIADDAELGSFQFYCAIHGILQRSEIEIVAADAEIPDQSEVNRRIREESKSMTDELERIYQDAKDDGEATFPGAEEPVEGPFAGLPGEGHTAINEFVPRVLTAKAGEPITWKMLGSDHTISFNVPRYFPIMEFLDDGTVRINPKLQPPAGGAIAYEPPEDSEDAEGEGSGEAPSGEEPSGEAPSGEEPSGPPTHDGGEFDGSGFWSSGLIGGEPYLEYTMRITKPGTYAFACLLHPRMVGQIKVT